MPAPRPVPLTPAAVAAPLAEPTLALRNVSKVYRDGDTEITALHPTTFEVRPGELVAVNGPSGSGKSTLLSIAGALLRPTTGQGRSPAQRRRPAAPRRRMMPSA